MYKLLYKIDYVLQRFFTSLVFTIPVIKYLKKIYFYLRFKSVHIEVTNNVVITNFDKFNENTDIKFMGPCVFSRNIEVDYSGGIIFGKNVTISNNVIIQTHKHEYDNLSLFENRTSSSPLIIGDEVWVCNNVIITNTVTNIGKGAIIAAGSVVTKNVAPNSIVAGVPAKHLKYRKLSGYES
ncbi:acyltransferase [Algibacter amylolyticus]|uniref:Acyltransferase n=1 Tax=Algibacter amylolyticus TaxID=1608400 RepID=A0A5M7AYJ4_9FLAO|nr:acyltransferase [Algibacter amylolyticus]KAA5822433.1 acyltransferase [Algibacter amylolyticus]MBB5269155.1 acetyltransferase-like isoleucine patch superfamily enzyme [Algibacter amylolyticus]TSJ73583.1 acyltransferase [Algibacter amylolyticus]